MPIDPVTVDVIANALRSLVSEMDAAIERTSMSIVIREQHDFGMSLVDHRGRMISGTIFTGQTLAEYACSTHVGPGDVIMLNDPYLSHGEISHLGDTMLAVPVFWEGRLIAWGIAWGHHMDIGATAPAGMPTQATEVFNEGLQIPPVKLYEAGVLNQGILDIVARNSRTPEMMVGDTLALVAAGKIAEMRVHELCSRFGGESVLAAIDVLFERARETMRRLIALLPDEPITFEDVLDNDGINDEFLTISVALHRHGDRLIVDLTGTSPQSAGPMNLTLDPSYLKVLLYDMLRLAAGSKINIDAQLDPNQGIEDLVEVRVPENSLVSPKYPAPVGLRHLTRGRLREIIQAILARVFPDTVPAAASGSLNSYSMLGIGETAEDRWLCFEVTVAGGGARPFSDGIDGYSFNNRLKNAPVEFVETVYPIRIEQYSLRAGSAGAGKYRGGHGLIRAIRVLRPANLHFLDERQRTQPWGLYGGRAAASNDAYVERADGVIVMLPGKFDRFVMSPNDMFVMRTGGGGGWGDPHERDVDAVRHDVECGLLTAAQARDLYGLLMDGEARHTDAREGRHPSAGAASADTWIDRGEQQRVPPPGEFWELSEVPIPWVLTGAHPGHAEDGRYGGKNDTTDRAV